MTAAVKSISNSDLLVLADTHCHLDLNNFDEDRDEVIQRAKDAGIARILIPGTNLSSSRKSVKLALDEDILFAAIGYQPNDSLDWDDGSLQDLKDLYHSSLKGSNRKIAAIGEIGLDYYWDAAPHLTQKQVLLKQLDLASELSLPIVVHLREKDDATSGACSEDLLEILGDWVRKLKRPNKHFNKLPGVLHSFSGDLDTARKAISLGFLIGVTGPVTFKNAKVRQEMIAGIDLEHIILETDAPYLTPHPLRGKRNEPRNIGLIAKKISEIHEVSLARVAEITNANAKKLFQW